jgi:hypothetical protein
MKTTRPASSPRKDYRLKAREAAGMSPFQIVEKVVYAVDEDAPDITDDIAMQPLLASINPVLAAVYSAWMTAGFIAGDGLYSIFECCCADMLCRAPYGFHLLGHDDVARAVAISSRIFPRGAIPLTASKRGRGVEAGDAKFGLPELELGGLDYTFKLPGLFQTDALLARYRYEFMRP